jgi:hypothetical protein
MWQEKIRKQKNVKTEQIWKTVEISNISRMLHAKLLTKLTARRAARLR